VWSVTLYAAETWTLTEVDRDRIEALEMWIWQRMENISWMDKVPNEDVMKKVNESKNMLNVIRQRKCKWIGHVLRHDEFLQEIFEGRMKGRSTRGRKRIQLLDDLADGKDYASLKREAEDRSMWRVKTVEMVVKDLLLADNQRREDFKLGYSKLGCSSYAGPQKQTPGKCCGRTFTGRLPFLSPNQQRLKFPKIHKT